MDGDRCSRCAAALPVGAPWCTLCFAAVPESTPAAEPATSVLALVAAAATDVAPSGLPTDVADHRALPAGAPEKAPRWPCQSCGGTVPLAEPRSPPAALRSWPARTVGLPSRCLASVTCWRAAAVSAC